MTQPTKLQLVAQVKDSTTIYDVGAHYGSSEAVDSDGAVEKVS